MSNLAFNNHNKETAKAAEQAMKQLIDATNVMGSDQAVAKGMIVAIMQSHPTLVQSFFRAIVSSCQGIVNETPHYLDDGRLTGSKDLIKQIAAFDKALPFI